VPAFLVLTAEETELVRDGSIAEPSYRPHPNGSHTRLDYENELREADGLPPIQGPPARPLSFPRTLAAHQWKQHSLELMLLTAQSDADQPGLEIIAVGRGEGGRRGGAPGTRLVEIGPWERLGEPVRLERLVAGLEPARRSKFQEVMAGRSRPLPPILAAAVENLLADIVPDFEQLRQRLQRPNRRARSVRSELATRDACSTALGMFLPGAWRSLRPDPLSELTGRVADIEDLLRSQADENDYLVDDSAIFADWDAAPRPVAGWRAFRHQSRRLFIKNVNVQKGEFETGADLVYVRTEPNAVVLVQYKVLERLESTNEPIFRLDARMDSQIDRMLSFEHLSVPDINHADDYRFSPSFSFVKFIDDQGQRGLEDKELTRGHYIPAALVKEMVKSPDRGPKGGGLLYIDHHRSFDSLAFTRLVHDYWIGSRGTTSDMLADVLRAPTSRSLVLAVEQTV
jgi:hypothetical protein